MITALFRKSGLMRELLGDELSAKYANTKEQEAREFNSAVTDWEVSRYLDKC